MHDPRVGRFFRVDPLYSKYPWNSTYAFSENRVVDGVELEGLEYQPFAGRLLSAENARLQANIKKKENPDNKNIWAETYAKWYLEGYQAEAAGTALGASIFFGGTGLYMGIGPASLANITYTNILRGGATGGILSGTISAVQGDEPLDIVKNTFSGFVSGAILGPGGNGTKELITRGTIGGAIGEYANQIFENEFQDGDGYDIKKIVQSGGVGAASNLVSGKLLESLNKYIASQEARALSRMETQEYRDVLAKELKTQFPNIKTSGRQFKQLLNETLKEQKQLIKEQGNQLRVAFERIIEGSSEIIESKVKEKLDED
ncbi:hypothetical protein LDL77_19240 [Flagellimonas marinaquae]|uniref:hypothetical protein n=1 Tax=Flagellimonas aurea TaxID=2915619 RepID=UPI001CE0DFAA|nr:hypothetical protein LDL77_19240 [Allomuricauda aquimarina]